MDPEEARRLKLRTTYVCAGALPANGHADFARCSLVQACCSILNLQPCPTRAVALLLLITVFQLTGSLSAVVESILAIVSSAWQALARSKGATDDTAGAPAPMV